MGNSDLFKFNKTDEHAVQMPDMDGDEFRGMKYTHEYIKSFKNEYYEATFWLATNEKGDRLAEHINPYDYKQLRIMITKNPGYEHLQYISASSSYEVYKEEKPFDFLIGEPFCRTVHFERMHGETGDWEIAARTCIAINDLFEKMFPGHFMTKKKTW